MIFQLLISLTLLSSSFCYISNKIVGGHKIDIEEVPFQVAIFLNSSIHCGGSLISKEFVLSAAHCFYGPFPDNILTVKIGTSTPYDGSGMSLMVKLIYNHEKYDPFTNDYDFSLLRLYDVDSLPPVVQFAKLPTAFDTLNSLEEVFISGWGKTEMGVESKVLLGATVQIINFEKCSKLYEKTNELTDRMICAGRIEGKVDACQGDSGGPLFRKSDGILFGITSFGYGCGDARFPGVYAKVSYAIGWIQNVINLD